MIRKIAIHDPPQPWPDVGSEISLPVIRTLNNLYTPLWCPCVCDPYANIVYPNLVILVLVCAVCYPIFLISNSLAKASHPLGWG